MKMGLISTFKRTTSSKNFIPEIDGLRFIAIMTVVVFHFHFLFSKEVSGMVNMDIEDSGVTSAGWWLVRLDLGVKVFFGISGFILSIPFFNQYWFGGKKVNTKEYFIRRLTRLEPPFLVAVTGFFVVHLVILGASFSEYFPNYIATLFYVHTLVYDIYSIINPITWSLETEVQFYLLIPVLAWLLLKSGKKMMTMFVGILLFLGSIAFKGYVLAESPYGLIASLPVFFSHFLVGIGFAYIYLVREEWLRAKSFMWDLIGLISFFGLFWFYKPQNDFVFQICFNTSIFVFFMAVFKGKLLNRFFTQPIIFLIGGMCYTIYLLHLAFFGLFVKFSGKLLFFDSYSSNFLLQFVLAFFSLMLVSGLFFIFIEKPCMDKNWHKNLGKKLGIYHGN